MLFVFYFCEKIYSNTMLLFYFLIFKVKKNVVTLCFKYCVHIQYMCIYIYTYTHTHIHVHINTSPNQRCTVFQAIFEWIASARCDWRFVKQLQAVTCNPLLEDTSQWVWCHCHMGKACDFRKSRENIFDHLLAKEHKWLYQIPGAEC